MMHSRLKHLLLIISIALISISNALAEPQKGDIRKLEGELQVWHPSPQQWLNVDDFFLLELKRFDGPTYGYTNQYPDYDSVKERDTLIEVLIDGRTCPMMFFHSRWRRLPDVLGLNTQLRNYGGCRDVFK